MLLLHTLLETSYVNIKQQGFKVSMANNCVDFPITNILFSYL